MTSSTDRIEMSIDVAASPDRIFHLYTQVSNWPQWDPDLEAAGIDGPFEAGTSGWIKPQGAPRLKTRLLAVNADRSFTAESKVPGCRLHFHHRLERLGNDQTSLDPSVLTRVTHTVTFQGALSGLIRRAIGPRLREALPGAMAGLKAEAEAEGAG